MTQNSIFSNLLSLSGYGYQWIWCGLEVLFPPPKGFNTTLIISKKVIFWWKKVDFCYSSHSGWNSKMQFFHPKNRFFQTSSNFQDMITSVSGADWGSYFLPQKVFSLSSTSVVLAAIWCGLNLTTIVRIGFVIFTFDVEFCIV